MVPPPRQPNRTQACLYAARAQRLHATPLLAPRTPRRDRPRLLLEPSRRQPQDGFQQRRCHRTPRGQHAVLMLGQAVIAMGSRALQQRTAEPSQRLYDLVREVVRVLAFPDPSFASNSGGSLLVIRSLYPACPPHR
jgi:hypothetical protein